MESISPEGFEFFNPQGYDKIYREGKTVLMNILDIEVPLTAAVNGPCGYTSNISCSPTMYWLDCFSG
jgi:hypothetical protein